MDNFSNAFIFTILLWFSVVFGSICTIISTLAAGKHVSELQYQRVKRINGIRKIESWIEIRKHGNRALFFFVFVVAGIVYLIDPTNEYRIVTRILFIIVAIAFAGSAIVDWIDEERQLRILMRYEELHSIPLIRLELHKLSNLLAILWGMIEFEIKPEKRKDFEELQEQVNIVTKNIQMNIRDMDPSYIAAKTRTGADVNAEE